MTDYLELDDGAFSRMAKQVQCQIPWKTFEAIRQDRKALVARIEELEEGLPVPKKPRRSPLANTVLDLQRKVHAYRTAINALTAEIECFGVDRFEALGFTGKQQYLFALSLANSPREIDV